MSRHRFRFCSFATPEGWLEVPGLGAFGPEEGDDRLSATARELWPVEKTPASALAEEHRAALDEVHTDFELVQESPIELGEDIDAHQLVYTHADEPPRHVTEIIAARGPVVLHLLLSGPPAEDEPRDRLFSQIANTLRFERGDTLAEAQPQPLLSAAAPNAAAGAAPVETTGRVELAKACVSIPLPTGWEAFQADDGDNDSPGIRARDAGVTVTRPLDAENDTDTWLNRRMSELEDSPATRVKGWETGELTDSRPFAGLAYTTETRGGSWSTPDPFSCLEFATCEEMLLVWSLRVGKDGWYPGAAAAFHTLLHEFELLDPETWETETAEPWLKLTLLGPWVSEGPGIYVKQREDERLIIQLSQQDYKQKIDKAKPSMVQVIDSFRNDSPVLEVYDEQEASGVWRGVEAFRYSMDAEIRDQGPISVRAVSALSDGVLYTCLLHGSNRDEAQSLFLETLEDLHVPGMKAE